jgi:hypothetical protein
MVMKANELKKGVYEMLTSIGYARKVNNFDESTVTQFGGLADEVKAAIKTFPVLDFNYSVDLMDVNLDSEQQFYVFHNTTLDGYFLVDTQGYNYPRYITRLWGFKNEKTDDQIDDIFERMEGLIRMADGNIFDAVVYSLSSELILEGFTADQVDAFLQFKLEQAVNKLP